MDSVNPIDVSMLARIAFDGGQGRGRRRGGREGSLPRLVEDAWAERLRILVKVAEGIEMRAGEIALIECMDSGPAPRFMAEAAIRGRRTSASSPTKPPAQRTDRSHARPRRRTRPRATPSAKCASSRRGCRRLHDRLLNGERCTSSWRLLVQAPIHDEVTKHVAEAAKRK